MNSWWTAKPLLVVGVPFSGKGRFPIIPIVLCKNLADHVFLRVRGAKSFVVYR